MHRDIVVWRTQYKSSKTWGILGNISPLSILPRFTGPGQKSTGTFWTVCVGTNIMMDYLISDWSTQNNRALSHEHRDGGRCGLIRGIFLLWVSLWGGMMQSTWNKPQNTDPSALTEWPCGTTVFMNRVKSPLITAMVWHSSQTILNDFPIFV